MQEPASPSIFSTRFISYAQNCEDVMLWRALGHVASGFYIDVGAQSPESDSVTKAFSLRGWRGINVEPHPYYLEQLRQLRPDDINLGIAVGDQVGRVTMSLVDDTGLSTADADFARQHAASGYAIRKHKVDVNTLAQVWREHVPVGQDVHFLKVDVEGFERAVLTGNDWMQCRPWIVLVEAMLPNEQVECHEAWEPILTTAGYRFVYADGLNRFYVADERSALAQSFRYPPNVFDSYVGVALSSSEAQCAVQAAELRRLGGQVASLDKALNEAHARIAYAEAASIQARERALAIQDQFVAERAALHEQLGQVRDRAESAERERSALVHSPWWRLTGPARKLVGAVPPSARMHGRRLLKAAWWAVTPWKIPARLAVLRSRRERERDNRSGEAEDSMTEQKVRLALDTYVLAQGIKTGVYRVCDELYPRLVEANQVASRLYFRDKGQPQASSLRRRLDAPVHMTSPGGPGEDADVLLSPFGVAPAEWKADPRIQHAHIVYDLIAIHHPEYFTDVGAREVRSIMDSLDRETVVFAISECTKRDLLDYRPDLDPGQITVIPLAAGRRFRPQRDPSVCAVVRAKYGIPANAPYALSLATLEVRKNLDVVVRALALHLEEHTDSDLHLVLSGMSGWKLEGLHKALEAAGRWRHRIILTGFVEEEDLAALYSEALVFCYLSRYEGFGLPPLEAMACGTPVVCSDNSSLPEVVGEAGLLVEASDAPAVARALQLLRTSATMRSRLSQAGLDRARLFSWDRCAEIILNVLVTAHLQRLRRPDALSKRPIEMTES